MQRTRAILLGFIVLVCAATARAQDAASAPAPESNFAEQVDLTPLREIAVLSHGRLKSFDSHASSWMQRISGPRRINGQSPSYSFLDLIIRPQQYLQQPTVYVKKKPIRAQMVRALEESAEARTQFPDLAEQMDSFMETGLIAPMLLTDPGVIGLLERMSQDLIRSARFVDEIDSSLSLMQGRVILDNWKIVPPLTGDDKTPWLSLIDLVQMSQEGTLNSPKYADILMQWQNLFNAWMNEQPAEASAAVAAIAELLPTVNVELYPEQSRLRWESWYFRMKNLTWGWLLYVFALIPLLLHVVFRWRGARWVGIALFLVAFGFHTFAVMLRWHVAGRWPNSNMFEAVTTSAWFGVIAALILEFLARRTRMRSLFAIGGGVSAMVALMCAHFMPVYLNPNIDNMMPVLHDVWLYIHTNVIIFSYCLIFMAAVTAMLYLIYRGAGLFGDFGSHDDYARVGGAGSLIVPVAGGGTYVESAKTTIGQVLDGTTMILTELAFVFLWTGLVMGAIWADHSWGRPWGWDPKEVFALNTFIVFAVLIHVRLTARDKGLWTAIIALVGAGVMLFNWIAINFIITGLHSYA